MSRMIQQVLLVHAAVLFPTSLAAVFFLSRDWALSYAFGGLVVFINTGLMMWAWSWIMARKNTQLAIFLLLLKYMILLGFIFFSGSLSWLQTGAFLAGLSTFFVPLAALSFLWWRSQGNRS